MKELNEKRILLLNNIITPNLYRVKELVADGVDFEFEHNGCPPLTYAIFYASGIAKYLIEQGANPSYMPKEVYNEFNKPFFYLYETLSEDWTNNPVLVENTKDLRKYLKQYNIQKLILEKHPNSIFDMIKYKIILPEIEKEFSYLITANELNLM